jgi:hypothetical protein
MTKARSGTRKARLTVGDRVRILAIPGADRPDYFLHQDTKRAYKTLVARRRSVRICKIGEDGLPWFDFRIKLKNGIVEYHSMCIMPDDDNWVIVKHRQAEKRR